MINQNDTPAKLILFEKKKGFSFFNGLLPIGNIMQYRVNKS